MGASKDSFPTVSTNLNETNFNSALASFNETLNNFDQL